MKNYIRLRYKTWLICLWELVEMFGILFIMALLLGLYWRLKEG